MTTLQKTAPGPQTISLQSRHLVVVAILIVAAAARLYNLRDSPPWYHDETIYVGEAWNLIHGRFQWDTVEHTFLPRLPLFHLLVGPLLLAFGKDVVWVRLVAAGCGILTTWLVYLIGRQVGSRRSALLAMALFAICPYVVLLNRWGFSYNLDCVLGAAGLYFLLRHGRRPDQRRHLWLASAMTGLGMAVDPVMASRFAALALVAFLTVGKRRALAATAASLAPLALYFAVMLLFFRRIFLQDVEVILFRRLSPQADWFILAYGAKYFISVMGGYGALGVTGLAFLRGRKARRLLWAVFALDVVANLKLSVNDTSLIYRMFIILTPPLFVGLGCLLDAVWARIGLIVRGEARAVEAWMARRMGRGVPDERRRTVSLAGDILKWFALALIAALAAWSTYLGVVERRFPLQRHFSQASLAEIADAEATAEWLNQRLEPDDLVITTHMEWMLDCRTASPMLAHLAEGAEGTGVYFPELRERFVCPSRFADARYVIFHKPFGKVAGLYGVAPRLQALAATWPKVHAEGSVHVYANPAFQ
jgi:4-amino-4-deoxy-L-arabinose transferase-like glycosyltransferase